jgi:hypothetical protein
MKRLALLVSLAALVAACGSSPTAPSAPAATTPTAAVSVASFVVTSEASGTGSVYHANIQFRETGGVAATLSALTFSMTGTNGSATATLPTTRIAAGGTLTTPTIDISDSANATAGATSVALSATFKDDNAHSGTIGGTATIGRTTPAPTPTPAPATTFTLTGTVTDGTSHGILPNITVQISSGTNVGKSAVTDGSGNYTLSGLTAGTFTVSVGATSYQTTTQQVTLTGNARVDLVLQRVAAAPTPTPNPTPTPTPGNPRTSFGAGQYLVGTDIAAGRYYSTPGSNCYWERQSGLGGTLAEIIANDFIGFSAPQWIVDILPSDRAFKTESSCGTWTNSPRAGGQSNIPPGMWLVGSQISAGTYSAAAQSGCYWERLSNFQGVLSSITANNFVGSAGQQLVTISSGDAGFDTNPSCGTWTRVGSILTNVEAQSSTGVNVGLQRVMYDAWRGFLRRR